MGIGVCFRHTKVLVEVLVLCELRLLDHKLRIRV